MNDNVFTNNCFIYPNHPLIPRIESAIFLEHTFVHRIWVPEGIDAHYIPIMAMRTAQRLLRTLTAVHGEGFGASLRGFATASANGVPVEV